MAVGLLGGTLLAGAVIEGFDDTLSKVIALSFFVPAVMAIGGNTGIQTATVPVRSLAIGQGQWGSGPLITTLKDGLSLLLYFGIAAFFL